MRRLTIPKEYTEDSGLIIFPDGSKAFIDPPKGDHEHDSDGPDYFQTASGDLLFPWTYEIWASYTRDMRNPLLYKYQQDIGDPIVAGGCTCSKCYKPVGPDPWEDEYHAT